MRVIITEEQFQKICKILNINEALIDEDQEAKSINSAKDLFVSRLGWDRKRADKFVRIRLRSLFPELKTKDGGKFILGTARLYIDGELNNGKNISAYNTILKYLSSSEFINSFDRNLNDLHLSDLIEKFSERINTDLNNDKNKLSKNNYSEKNDYEIVEIYSFKDAAEYAKYCNWCITRTEVAFNQYSNNQTSQFYFCLKNGFQKVPKVAGENAPLDDYGLSMIAICVNRDGLLVSCTTRWNDKNGGTMNALTTEQISELIGKNFYDVFKPSSSWKDDLSDAEARLKNGENSEDIFQKNKIIPLENGLRKVKLHSCYNYLTKENKLLSHVWFDSATNFQDGIAVVSVGDDYNCIDINGKFLSEEWYKYIGTFSKGVAFVVRNDEKYNFINTNGEIISKIWFNDIDVFNDSKVSTLVMYKSKYNFINRDGEFLFNPSLTIVRKMDNLFYYIKSQNGKYNFVNKNGELLSDQWFDWAGCFKNGIAPIEIKSKTYTINENGEIKSPIKEGKEEIYYTDPQKVLIVAKFLDKNFKRGTMSKLSNNGYPITEKIIAMKDSMGNVIKNFYPNQLYNLLDDKFHYIYTNPDKRRRFIKKIINDWMNNKISKEGLLSTNTF